MFKMMSLIVVLLLSVNVFAAQDIGSLLAQQLQISAEQPVSQGLQFKVGDHNWYNLQMGFIAGTMEMYVREIIADGVWIVQDLNLGFMGKQKIETLLDPNTGKVKKMIVNGQEQTPPETDIEIVEAREDQITVPAGTYKCIYFKIHDNKQNQDMQQWVNLKEIPINGMLKSLAPSQLGEVDIQLTKFQRGQ